MRMQVADCISVFALLQARKVQRAKSLPEFYAREKCAINHFRPVQKCKFRSVRRHMWGNGTAQSRYSPAKFDIKFARQFIAQHERNRTGNCDIERNARRDKLKIVVARTRSRHYVLSAGRLCCHFCGKSADWERHRPPKTSQSHSNQ